MSSLRMKDLVERTGASREAIRFYINEGLLPEPKKTSRNMAWYGREHVERLRYIRALQDEHYLPLKAIRAVLNGEDQQQFTDHQRHQFEILRRRIQAEHAGEARRPFAQVAAELGLSVDECDAVREIGIVNADNTVGPQDQELIQLWVSNRVHGLTPERGFSPRDIGIVQDAVDVLFKAELAMFTQRLGDMDDEELAQLLDRVIPNINRVFALLYERKLRAFLEQTNRGETPQGDTA